jgi:transcriptional regulator with XRE-family HTH domain
MSQKVLDSLTWCQGESFLRVRWVYEDAMNVPYGPRIRAARCFAGLSQTELAQRVGREKQWVVRRERDAPRPEDPVVEDRDLILVAEATKVPIEFLRQGWPTVQPDQPSIEERMEALESRVEAVLRLATTRTARSVRESTEDSGRDEDPGDAAQPGHGD